MQREMGESMRQEVVCKLLKVAWEVPWESFREAPESYRLVELYTGLVLGRWNMPVCDVCPFTDGLPPTVLAKGRVPVVHGVFIVYKKGESRDTIFSPFALCAECQASMNIQPGDIVVPLARFKNHGLKGMRATGKKLGWPKARYAPESHGFYLVES